MAMSPGGHQGVPKENSSAVISIDLWKSLQASTGFPLVNHGFFLTLNKPYQNPDMNTSWQRWRCHSAWTCMLALRAMHWETASESLTRLVASQCGNCCRDDSTRMIASTCSGFCENEYCANPYCEMEHDVKVMQPGKVSAWDRGAKIFMVTTRSLTTLTVVMFIFQTAGSGYLQDHEEG